jgi:hypothetical protein
MSKIGVKLKIDVKKLQKELFFIANSGAVYADLTTFIDLDNKDRYDQNGFISQDVSKEAREAGTKGPIVGNVSVFWSDLGQAQQQPTKQSAPVADDFDGEQIPF